MPSAERPGVRNALLCQDHSETQRAATALRGAQGLRCVPTTERGRPHSRNGPTGFDLPAGPVWRASTAVSGAKSIRRTAASPAAAAAPTRRDAAARAARKLPLRALAARELSGPAPARSLSFLLEQVGQAGLQKRHEFRALTARNQSVLWCVFRFGIVPAEKGPDSETGNASTVRMRM